MYNFWKKIIVWWFLFISLSSVFASDRDLPGINIVSRSERWADESIRYTEMSYADRKARQESKTEEEMKILEETNFDEFFAKQKEWYEKDMRNEYLNNNYPDEQKVDKVVYQVWSNYLSWPQVYHYEKSKIIVHHTASETYSFTGKDSVIWYLKDVYKFHAIKRWWWDVWYNFLIDPYWNVYEGRAWWDSVIWAHTVRNNTPSVGISLMWNFDKQKPTTEQINSLVALITALSKKYNIDPTATTEYHKVVKDYPYMKSTKAWTIAGHRDAGQTSCPGKNIYSMLPKIRDLVMQKLAKWVLVSSSKVMNSVPTVKTIKSISSTTINTNKWLDMLKNRQPAYDKISQSFQQAYIKKHGTKISTVKSNKISVKITAEDAKKYINSDISVLLYELSTKFNKRNIVCQSTCSFIMPSWTYQSSWADIEIVEWWLLVQLNWKKYIEASVKIETKSDSIIEVKNYNRVSYYKIPRNTFYGSLIFEKWQIKNLKTSKFDNQYILINTLPFHKYLKGIVETNDSENKEKIKTMNLISKWYALFYMNNKNKHPSIPDWAKYTAIDSPDMFQKYIWAWLEKTLKIVPALVDSQKSEIILYDNYLPILPYFNCSAGFTWSAKDKRGWSDTPYLVSRIDIEKCTDFNGHWVGLSWKGAQYLSENWWNYKEILQYYYPGIQIINL